MRIWKVSALLNIVVVASSGAIALCEGADVPKKNISDYLRTFAEKGMAAVDAYKGRDLDTLFRDDTYAIASLKARDIIERGIPGQVGYGFLVGYASGFCVKKVVATVQVVQSCMDCVISTSL